MASNTNGQQAGAERRLFADLGDSLYIVMETLKAADTLRADARIKKVLGAVEGIYPVALDLYGSEGHGDATARAGRTAISGTCTRS